MIQLRDVVVQRLVRSKQARASYKLSPQRKPVASVDLRGASSMKTLGAIWKEEVGLRGHFSLSARDRRGRFSKCLGTIIVTGRDYEIRFEDHRCPLFHYMRKQTKQKRREREMDYSLGSRRKGSVSSVRDRNMAT